MLTQAQKGTDSTPNAHLNFLFGQGFFLCGMDAFFRGFRRPSRRLNLDLSQMSLPFVVTVLEAPTTLPTVLRRWQAL